MNDFAIIGFTSLLSLLGTIIVFQFKGMRDDLKQMNKSVQILNEQIAVIIKDQEWHKEELDMIKMKISQIESKTLRGNA